MYFNEEDTGSENVDSQSGDENGSSEAYANLQAFWPSIMDEIKKIKNVDAKNQNLPLARIKKIMKLDEDVKMISAEAPLLFAKASEIFIHELTLRAWVHTEDNKRRTLQKNDIAMAITKYDQFDFLIDIVPRHEVKPKKEPEAKTTINCGDQGQYYFQIAQQTLQGTSVGNVTPQGHNQLATQTLQLQSPTGQQVTLAAPQNIIVTSNPNQQMVVNSVQHGNAQPTQQIQLVQQIISPTGEITNIPVSPSQLNLIRMQMPNNTNQSPIIIQAPQMHHQAQPQIVHTATGQPQITTVYQTTGGQCKIEE